MTFKMHGCVSIHFEYAGGVVSCDFLTWDAFLRKSAKGNQIHGCAHVEQTKWMDEHTSEFRASEKKTEEEREEERGESESEREWKSESK